MTLSHKSKVGILACSLLMATGCERHKAPEVPTSKASFIMDVFPLANGTALISRLDAENRIVPILLSGNQMVKVTGMPKGADFSTAYPLADGTAYVTLNVPEGEGLFHLEGHNLVEVKETTQLTSSPGPSSATGFAWAQHAADLARKAKQEREDLEADLANRERNS